MKGIIVLTALPPTKGHGYLIRFASDFLFTIDKSASLHVIVCSKPNEPIDGWVRATSISDEFEDLRNVWVSHRDANDPDLPEHHIGFWSHWRNVVLSKVNHIDADDILFASEEYGVEFAEKLGCRFVPCDPGRDIFDIKAAEVRADPLGQFDKILPSFASRLQKRVTFFGAESTGKTTLSRYVADYFKSIWVHEWARPYLEMCGPEVTDERMANIVSGQWAAQHAASERSLTPFIVQDTDLFSTLGYYKIYGGQYTNDLRMLMTGTKSDLYLVMNSKIPFTPDRLRYGGNKRESTDQFWIDILEEYGLPYRLITEEDLYAQRVEAIDIMKRFWIEKAGFGGYVR